MDISMIPQQVTGLKDQIKTLEVEKTTLTQRAEAAESKIPAFEEQIAALQTSLNAATEKAAALEASLQASTAQVTALTAEAKDAETRAREIAGAKGVKASAKTNEGTSSQTDGAALYAQYEKLHGRERGAFFAKHEEALMAYAAELERAR